MNEEQYFHAARHFAITLHREHKNDEQRLNRAYEAITSHLPDDAESHDLQAALDALNYEYAKTPALAEALTKGLQLESDQRTEVAALSMVINSIFNLDVTKTRE